jgi:hypothetical protein
MDSRKFVEYSLPLLILVACSERSQYAETEAEVIYEGIFEGKHCFSYKYEVPESTAIDKKGVPIKGPIVQRTMAQNKPITPQKIKIRYRKDEPTIFEPIDEVKFK